MFIQQNGRVANETITNFQKQLTTSYTCTHDAVYSYEGLNYKAEMHESTKITSTKIRET